MKIAVLRERAEREHRVAITPETVKKFINLGIDVCIEKGAGIKSYITDEQYIAAGAKISSIPLEILADAQILLKVQNNIAESDLDEISFMQENTIIIGMLNVFENKHAIQQYANKKITSFALELLPRITRAQNMDVLSSQNNLAGYRAVIEALNLSSKVFPMMMTAAGTISPAKVLVLGAGVAGLQAIATAKRLGAIVSVFDVRKAAKEQVESLGASFIEVDSDVSFESQSGYAKETTQEYKEKQELLIKEALLKHDIVICTALIPGKKAPILINEEMLKETNPGTIIVDLAASYGGNCALSKKDKIVEYNGIKIIGCSNLPASMAMDASKLYARNLFNFVNLIYNSSKRELEINLDDEIIKNTLITYNGQIVHADLREKDNE